MIKCQKDEQNLKYISNLQQVRKGQMEERMCCITLMTHLLFNRLYYLNYLAFKPSQMQNIKVFLLKSTLVSKTHHREGTMPEP